ncbi:phytase [Arenimonas composti]|uniref:BPP domain-containing protein n=1 Tax=Arenimonas composti TR7-09 = DSM 18010 TaxID=1121013 RepID=A0A091BFA8_9GAMM|nr:phytase [Arenimonas composti]KFN49464.1 hypothetical protein P873_10855 [Arenimonas composti TR7-09 = DSM 18010]
MRPHLSILLASVLSALAAGCSDVDAVAAAGNDGAIAGDTGQAATVAARATTATSATGKVGSAAHVLSPAGHGPGRFVGSAALGGLEIYTVDGSRIGQAPGGEVAAVTVAYGLDVAGAAATVVAALDTTDNRLRLYRLQGEALEEVGDGDLLLGFAGEGLCSWRNPLDGSVNLFVVGDGGEIEQRQLHATPGGRVGARSVRRVSVPSTLTQCVVSRDGMVYATEEAVGVWRFAADPEADIAAALVESPRSGRLAGETKGVAIVDGGDGHEWLLVSDTDGGRINVYDRGEDDAFVGAFAPLPPGGGDPLEEPGPLFATTVAVPGFDGGVLAVADEEAADGGDFKLYAIAEVLAAVGREAGGAVDPRVATAAAVPVVQPRYETAPVPSFGDAADDPAIWAHPRDPARSLIVATDKKGGLVLYDMQGRQLQYLADGKMNNVDLRDGFLLGGKEVTLVTASDRTRRAVAIYVLDGPGRQLRDVADGVQESGLEDPYGLCMYRSAASGRTYVFINSGDGPLFQWELVDAGNGRVRAELVRQLRFESQTEGCVADDGTGTLFIGEEDVGIWKLSAEPDGGDTMTPLVRVEDNPALRADIEGMGLYVQPDGRGYLVASSQGNDTYAVFRREAPHDYVGSFAVASDGAAGIDGISETDGLDVSSANLGPGLERGAMVAQDGRNVMPVENQNYKVVPWSAIAEALGLD